MPDTELPLPAWSEVKRRISFGVFDTVGEETIHQKKMLRVKFGEQLYHETLTRNTINVAKDRFEQLENAAAKVLYLGLQRERINLTIKNQTVSDTNNRLYFERTGSKYGIKSGGPCQVF